MKEVKTVVDKLQLFRDQVEEFHDSWFETSLEMATKIDVEPVLPRSQRRKLGGKTTPSQYYKQELTIPLLGK